MKYTCNFCKSDNITDLEASGGFGGGVVKTGFLLNPQFKRDYDHKTVVLCIDCGKMSMEEDCIIKNDIDNNI